MADQPNPPDSVLAKGWQAASRLADATADPEAAAWLWVAAEAIDKARHRLWAIEGEDRP